MYKQDATEKATERLVRFTECASPANEQDRDARIALAAHVNMAQLAVESVRGAHRLLASRIDTAIDALEEARESVSRGGLDAVLNRCGVLQTRSTDIDIAVASLAAAQQLVTALDSMYDMTGVYRSAGIE